jgi:peptide/nickel transport system substrate-binding protein
MPGELTIPVRSSVPQLDNDHPEYQALSPATYLVLALCHETLAGPGTTPSRGGIPDPNFTTMQPRLAESWWPEVGGSWIVRLRGGLRSNLGNPLTSTAVRWGFERSFALDNIGAWRWSQVGGLDGAHCVEVMDEHHLRFRLRCPDPLFAAHLFWATPRIADATAAVAHATDEDPWSCGWLAENVAGFGAFELTDRNPDGLQFALRADHRQRGEPMTVALREVPSRADAVALVRTSQPTLVPGLRCDEARSLQSAEGVELISAWAGHASIEIDYNTPPFDDYRVRHALSYATPYDAVIRDGFLGLARRWRSPLKTYSTWYTPEYWHFETDVAAARSLLEAAGHADGLAAPLYIRRRPDTERIAAILQGAFADIGVELEVHDYSAAAAANEPGWMPPLYLRVDCGHNTTQPLYDLAHDYAPISPILGSSGTPGVCTWHPPYAGNPAFEQMMRDALLAPDANTRRERTMAFQRSIVEFAPAVFLAEQALFNAVNAAVPAPIRAYEHRLNQVVLFQNANSRYIGD